MTKIRRMSVFLVLLSSVISIATGVALDSNSPAGMANFRAVYYGARCLLQHEDPYQESEFLSVYRQQGGEFPSDPGKRRLFLRAVPVCVNLPTTLVLITPFALLTWGAAHVIWLILLAVSFILAAVLMLDLSRRAANDVSLALICILLANSQVLFAVGNTAGIAVSFCVVAVWCFLKDRCVPVGVLCLAISLALKPHDSGLVWFYFLLAGGSHRRRALQTLVVAVALALPAILWVSNVAPQWIQELKSNLSATSARGDISDPGPDSISRKGSSDVIIDLRSLISVFRDNPRIYNTVSYFICGSLLLVWSLTTIRSHGSPATIWYALASIAALSMLATYHRPYDAKLLLLACPACAMLWDDGGSIGKLALLITSAAVTLTGDIPLAVVALLTKNLNVSTMGLFTKIFTVPLIRPAPLVLLVMAIFYLLVYMRRTLRSVSL